jgi:hypothetical protein
MPKNTLFDEFVGPVESRSIERTNYQNGEEKILYSDLDRRRHNKYYNILYRISNTVILYIFNIH